METLNFSLDPPVLDVVFAKHFLAAPLDNDVLGHQPADGTG